MISTRLISPPITDEDPIASSSGSGCLMREAMEKGATARLALAGSIAGMLLIYPVTLIAGPRSLLLLLSGFCVGIDLWDARDAASNFFQGLLILGPLASLWATLTIPPATMARSRYSFVAAATGLLLVLLVVGFSVRAGLA